MISKKISYRYRTVRLAIHGSVFFFRLLIMIFNMSINADINQRVKINAKRANMMIKLGQTLKE